MCRHHFLVLASPFVLLHRADAQGQPVMVASFSLLGDMVRQIGGDRADDQIVADPASNADRGPMRLFAIRLGVAF